MRESNPKSRNPNPMKPYPMPQLREHERERKAMVSQDGSSGIGGQCMVWRRPMYTSVAALGVKATREQESRTRKVGDRRRLAVDGNDG